MKHRHWTDLSAQDQQNTWYGFHKFGIGVYLFDASTGEKLECWPDFESCTEEEIERYFQWCKEKGLEPCNA